MSGEHHIDREYGVHLIELECGMHEGPRRQYGQWGPMRFLIGKWSTCSVQKEDRD